MSPSPVIHPCIPLVQGEPWMTRVLELEAEGQTITLRFTMALRGRPSTEALRGFAARMALACARKAHDPADYARALRRRIQASRESE